MVMIHAKHFGIAQQHRIVLPRGDDPLLPPHTLLALDTEIIEKLLDYSRMRMFQLLPRDCLQNLSRGTPAILRATNNREGSISLTNSLETKGNILYKLPYF